MNAVHQIWAVVPVKDTRQAKQRLAALLTQPQRRELALAMVDDVLAALADVPTLAGILVVTIDDTAATLAATYGARVSDVGARDGHTGAVTAAARLLAADGFGMMQVPGDIPLVRPQDIRAVLTAHGDAPAFTIVPSRDKLGSNAVVISPADAVPLRFGDDSFYPHLDAARAQGIAPRVIENARIALDIDTPEDLAALLATPAPTRAHALLQRFGLTAEAIAPTGTMAL